jgi:hypothetical protein
MTPPMSPPTTTRSRSAFAVMGVNTLTIACGAQQVRCGGDERHCALATTERRFRDAGDLSCRRPPRPGGTSARFSRNSDMQAMSRFAEVASTVEDDVRL